MQIQKTQYTETKQLGTFRNHFGYSKVTEYSFELDHNISEKAFNKILEENGIKLYGFVSKFVKKVFVDINIDTMQKIYKYVFVAQEVEYV